MQATLTVLGSGTSGGVPSLGCACAVCTSTDPRDQRLRPSLLITLGSRQVVIDTPPDFRTQALRAGLHTVDAVFYTHGHADHILGMDDVRPYSFRRTEPIPLYGDARTIADLRRVFNYVFSDQTTESAVPRVTAQVLEQAVEVAGVQFEPLTVMHGRLPILGYRFGNVAYLTDVSAIPPATMERLQHLDVLFLDALRHRPHPTHFTVAQSLDVVAALRPRQAYFIHICHDLGHASTEAALPAHVRLAYDGMQVEVDL